MKIVLIEPAATEANVYSKLHMPLLEPVYLGTILKNRVHEVQIYNEDILRPSDPGLFHYLRNFISVMPFSVSWGIG